MKYRNSSKHTATAKGSIKFLKAGYYIIIGNATCDTTHPNGSDSSSTDHSKEQSDSIPGTVKTFAYGRITLTADQDLICHNNDTTLKATVANLLTHSVNHQIKVHFSKGSPKSKKTNGSGVAKTTASWSSTGKKTVTATATDPEDILRIKGPAEYNVYVENNGFCGVRVINTGGPVLSYLSLNLYDNTNIPIVFTINDVIKVAASKVYNAAKNYIKEHNRPAFLQALDDAVAETGITAEAEALVKLSFLGYSLIVSNYHITVRQSFQYQVEHNVNCQETKEPVEKETVNISSQFDPNKHSGFPYNNFLWLTNERQYLWNYIHQDIKDDKEQLPDEVNNAIQQIKQNACP